MVDSERTSESGVLELEREHEHEAQRASKARHEQARDADLGKSQRVNWNFHVEKLSAAFWHSDPLNKLAGIDIPSAKMVLQAWKTWQTSWPGLATFQWSLSDTLPSYVQLFCRLLCGIKIGYSDLFCRENIIHATE